MPPVGYQRPNQVDLDGISVIHVSEDGATQRVFDFGTLECPPALLRSLVQGFAVATGAGGRWRSTSSAEAGAGNLRRFIRDIMQQEPAPQRIEDVGPETWWTWRAHMAQQNRWPAAVNQMRGLLSDTPGLSDTTRQALRGRTRKPKTRLYSSYSRGEFQRIRSAASAVVRTAQRRIDANLATLHTFRQGLEPADAPTATVRSRRWTAGGILDRLAETGIVPDGVSGGGAGAECRALLNLDGATTINEALFPNSYEMLSIGILLTCTRGYSESVINGLTVATDRADDHAAEDPIHILHLDKPRRGPASRFSDESLTGDAGRVIDRATALTAHARQTMAALGCPTDSLILFRAGGNYRGIGAEYFRTRLPLANNAFPIWHKRTGLLADDGSALRVNFRTLRLTEQVLNAKPRQNTPAVSESVYRRPDPQTQQDAATAIIRGQVEAIQHAQATVLMRTLTEQEMKAAQRDPRLLAERLSIPVQKVPLLLSGALNTGTGACLDYDHSPFTQDEGGCTASFLLCLGCPNAVATPAHLPRLVALWEAMNRIGSAVTSAVWAEDYAQHHARLAELLNSNYTPEQRDAARREVSQEDDEMITRLLKRRLDA